MVFIFHFINQQILALYMRFPSKQIPKKSRFFYTYLFLSSAFSGFFVPFLQHEKIWILCPEKKSKNSGQRAFYLQRNFQQRGFGSQGGCSSRVPISWLL